MVIATAHLDDGTTLLMLGLSRVNRERLAAGQPMDISRESHGPAVPTKLKILIFAGETEEDMRRSLEPLIGPMTVQDQKKVQ